MADKKSEKVLNKIEKIILSDITKDFFVWKYLFIQLETFACPSS